MFFGINEEFSSDLIMSASKIGQQDSVDGKEGEVHIRVQKEVEEVQTPQGTERFGKLALQHFRTNQRPSEFVISVTRERK